MIGRTKTTGPKLIIRDPERLIAQIDDELEIGPILRELLAKHSLHVAKIEGLDHGWRLRTREGPILSVYRSGTVQKPQGQRPELASKFVEELQEVIDDLRQGRRRLSGPP
jgi:hypothetical protein